MNEFATTIERWYNEHKRDLPWRETTDPYQIWIYDRGNYGLFRGKWNKNS